jgi:hypothetical protein
MELKELLEKAKMKTIKKEEVFQYFGVKNIEGLEMALSNRFDKPLEDLSYLDKSFSFLYESREKEDYSPIEEQYMFYALCSQGIYGMNIDEISLINGFFGPIRTVMILDNLLKDKPEVIFYNKLYKQYLERKENAIYLVSSGFKKVVDFAEKNLQNLDQAKMESLINEFKDKAQEFVKQNAIPVE